MNVRHGEIDVTTAADFVRTAHRMVWCSVATVDGHGRPRSRILHPIWELARQDLRGSVITRPSPIKLAHLDGNPYVSCAYSHKEHGVAIAECRATWIDDDEEVGRVWNLFLHAPEPLRYDFTNAHPDGPTNPECRLLRLEPWRLIVNDPPRIAAGERAAVWTAKP
jgi:hypothetical protein